MYVHYGLDRTNNFQVLLAVEGDVGPSISVDGVVVWTSDTGVIAEVPSRSDLDFLRTGLEFCSHKLSSWVMN